MEYLEHGDLHSCVSAPLPEHEAQAIAHQLLEALRLMHRKNFTHRDLKPNVSGAQTMLSSLTDDTERLCRRQIPELVDQIG